MNSHVYFLIDTGALADGSAVSLMITRILVYLAAKNEAVTWNYETIDMRARQRSLAGHWKRKACARKQLTVDAINELTASLSSVKYTHDSATTRRRPALDGLHERLMCLEADVEWEDPALIRSPTRNSSLHSWTDPTRLNESVSVRSHLYIIGQAPQTLFELDEFVCGLSTHNSQGECRQAAGGTLLENLTKLRDGFIGNGIWESYARKRVGVSWIQPAGREDLADLDPVDILIGGVFGCCLEALGGCVINMAELVAETSLPFSSVFAPLHRTRTYPSWSRKFAREISAVIDRFAMTIDRDDGFHASSDAECSRPREWLLQFPNADTLSEQQHCQSTCGALSATRLVQINNEPRGWLKDGRLLRRYNLPEMVALASELKLSCLRHREWLAAASGGLVYSQSVSTAHWPSIVSRLDRPHAMCSVDGRGHALPSNQVILAILQPLVDAESTPASLEHYAAILSASCNSAAIYFMDFTTYAEIIELSASARLPADSNAELMGANFQTAWIENWAWRDTGDLGVSLQNTIVVDVSFDESLLEFGGSEHISPETGMPSLSSCLETTASMPLSMSDVPATLTTVEATLPVTSTLCEWYSEIYLQQLLKPVPAFGCIIDRLALICSESVQTDSPDSTLSFLTSSVLQSSAAIEDVFDANEQGKCSDKHGKQELYCAMRWQATQALADEESVRRDWQLRECQLQILLHLFAIERLRVQNSAECSETDRLVESLHELVDFLCVRVSLGDIYTRTGALGSNQNGDKTSTMVGGEVDDGNDFAAAFIGGASVAKFAGTLGDIVEELRIQCGWVPPVTREVQPKQLDQAEVLPEGKRRKGTPRKISKSSGERSEVIVRQPKLASRELSGRKLARHLDELIGGNKGPPRYDEASSSEGGGSSPSSWAAERRRQSLQPRLPAHLIRQIKTEVVSTSRPVLRTASATLPEPATAAAASRISSGGFACSLSSRSLGRSSSTRRKPLRRPALLACQNTSSSPPNNCRVDNLQVISEAQLSKRRRTGIHMPLDSSPPAFLQSSLVTPSNFVCGSDDDDDDGMQQMHGLGSKRALQF